MEAFKIVIVTKQKDLGEPTNFGLVNCQSTFCQFAGNKIESIDMSYIMVNAAVAQLQNSERVNQGRASKKAIPKSFHF